MKYKLPFDKPPITEALLDIRVEKNNNITLETLESFHEDVKESYPLSNKKSSWKGEIKFKGGNAPEIFAPSSKIDGYLFKTSDGKKIVQVRFDGFTFNKLQPYQSWEVFQREAKELWKHYVRITQPNKTIRLALRYINKIEIPLPVKDFKEYILTVPDIAPNMPQALSTYFMRLEIPKQEIEAIAIITQTFKKIKSEAKVLPLIFDIDVFRSVKLDPSSKKVWSVMDTLRDFKNEIFLNSTTDKAKELFK